MRYLIILPLLIAQLALCGQESNDQFAIGQKHTIYSDILGENRDIFVYYPPGFWGMDEQIENLPVVYVLDGESQFLNTVATIDLLSAAPNGNDRMPRSIVVGIPNTNRSRDLTPVKIILEDGDFPDETGGGNAFLDFITSELIPYIDLQYSTCEHRTIIGHSFGGLITFEALLSKREYFNNYVSIDPALGLSGKSYYEELIDTLSHSNLMEENLFVSVANNMPTFLSLDNLLEDESTLAKLGAIPNRLFLNESDTSQWKINLTTKYYSDENHFSAPHQSTYDALRTFYHYYQLAEITNYYHPKYKDKTDLLALIEQHYQMISDKMGCPTTPMAGYINSYAFGIGQYDREDLAIDLFEYNIKKHPTNPVVYNNLGYYYRSTGETYKALEIYKQSVQIKEDENIKEIIKELEQLLKK